MDDEDKKLDRLLAGEDRMAPPEKEELFDEIYDDLEAERDNSSSQQPAIVYVTAAAAVLLAAFVSWNVLRAPGTSSPTSQKFQARGGDAGPTFGISCIEDGEKVPCRRGTKLTFRIRGASDSYFAAFAERSDGTVIWYFPDGESEKSYRVETDEGGIIDKAVQIGEHHSPGTYTIWGVFSERALERSEIKKHITHGNSKTITTVTEELKIR